jgi:shikimate kinase/3-dehydroquinate synthase
MVANASNLEALLGQAEEQAAVVDVASEAWLDRRTRVLALDRGVVVSLHNAFWHDGTRVSGRNGSCEERLWENAETAFCEAHQVFGFDRRQVASISEEVTALWRRDPIAVAAGGRSYVVDIGRGIVEQRCGAMLGGQATILLITDSNVNRLMGNRVDDALLATGSRVVKVVMAAGEESKHLGTMREIFEQAQCGGIDRSSTVVAVGGGVVTDIGGFVAATWMRGLPWIGVPTTLLGMVDASVGGKTAVDFGAAKNAIGAFWQPASVVCDIEWLRTESQRNYSSALAEVIKSAIIGDRGLFEILERNRELILGRDLDLMVEVVRRCVKVKARIVGLDERESGLRAVLNLGHTVGHALEAQEGFGRWSHGEAVSRGLVAALRVGARLGFTSEDLGSKVVDLLRSLGLPVGLPRPDLEAATELLCYDKKRAGSKMRFLVVRDIGEVKCHSIMLEDLRELLPSLSD